MGGRQLEILNFWHGKLCPSHLVKKVKSTMVVLQVSFWVMFCRLLTCKESFHSNTCQNGYHSCPRWGQGYLALDYLPYFPKKALLHCSCGLWSHILYLALMRIRANTKRKINVKVFFRKANFRKVVDQSSFRSWNPYLSLPFTSYLYCSNICSNVFQTIFLGTISWKINEKN